MIDCQDAPMAWQEMTDIKNPTLGGVVSENDVSVLRRPDPLCHGLKCGC